MEADAGPKQSATPLEVLYFRHAYSRWNKYYKDDKSMKDDIVIEEKYVDPEITNSKGVEGSQQLSGELATHVKDIRVVFISPMVRTIQTADLAFSPHPESKQIHFILHPLVMSRVNHPTDISFNWKEAVAKASIKIDTSLMDQAASERGWQFKYLLDYLAADDPRRAEFEQARVLMNSAPSVWGAFEAFSKQMALKYTIYEDEAIVRQRLTNLSRAIQDYALQHQLQGHQIVVVSHNGIVKRLFKSKSKNAVLLTGALQFLRSFPKLTEVDLVLRHEQLVA